MLDLISARLDSYLFFIIHSIIIDSLLCLYSFWVELGYKTHTQAVYLHLTMIGLYRSPVSGPR